MEPLIPRASFFPTLVFDPNIDNARMIAGSLERRGISVHIAGSAPEALRLAKDVYHRAVIVVADLTDEDCLQLLDSMHRAAPRSWLIVANGRVDRELRKLVYRHGADALVETPVDIGALVQRIASFQARSRPIY